jgi:hypothetical protein
VWSGERRSPWQAGRSEAVTGQQSPTYCFATTHDWRLHCRKSPHLAAREPLLKSLFLPLPPRPCYPKSPAPKSHRRPCSPWPLQPLTWPSPLRCPCRPAEHTHTLQPLPPSRPLTWFGSRRSPIPRGFHPLFSHNTFCRLPSSPRTFPLFLFFHASTRSRCAALKPCCAPRRCASSASFACGGRGRAWVAKRVDWLGESRGEAGPGEAGK